MTEPEPAPDTRSAETESNRRFEIRKIFITAVSTGVVNAVVLFGVAYFATYLFNHALEDYKAERGWAAEIARQRIAAVHELMTSAFTLRARHSDAAELARLKRAVEDAEVQAAIRKRTEAANGLLAAYSFAKTLFPADVTAPFRDYQRRVLAAPITDATGFVATADLDASLDAAIDRAVRYTTETSRSGGAHVATPAGVPTKPDPPCAFPVATTGGVQKLTTTSATLIGKTSPNAADAWFEFGVTAELGWSIDAEGGTGVANGLQPGKTYYYRFVAQNACGTCFGDTRSFTAPSGADGLTSRYL